MFRDLKLTNSEEKHQEGISLVASLKDLHSENLGNLTAIPVSGLQNFDALDVHKRIGSVAVEIAADFGFKEDVQAEAPFRLINQDDNLNEVLSSGQLPSFIALSYCWHNTSWEFHGDPVNVPIAATNVCWPISIGMVKALLLERTSLEEGIWIDQCCINQDDPQEKSQIIGFMNCIYEQARVVVVVLEDVVIDEAERVFLETLMQKCSSRGPKEPYTLLESNSTHRVVGLALKIFSARWFTRAWCNHELLVSKNHILLIGVRTPSHDQPKVLRLTLQFLDSMVLVCSSYDYTGAKDKHHLTLMAQYRNLRFLHIILNPFGLGGGYSLGKIDDDHSIARRLKSPVETFRNLSRFGATVAADKLTITLNIVGSGLYYKGTQRPEHECGLLISVVALAAGDPAVLCSSGDRYELLNQSARSSWIQRPEHLDFTGIAGRKGTHRRIDYVPSFTLEQVELDFFHLTSNSGPHIRRASEPFLTQAQQYIDGCIEMSKSDPMFQLGATLADQRGTKIQILACALECGPQWINNSASAKTSTDYPDPDLEQAIEVLISDRRDMELGFQGLTERYRDLYEVLTDFIETLMLDYISPINVPDWSPAWISVGPGEMDQLLLMCPNYGRPFSVMIPSLLLHADYTNCKRFFLLERVSQKADIWKVIGKSMAFCSDLDVLTRQESRLRRRQMIRA
ncbi:MAG: hypothetical protein Q9201_001681 [Fulgogasparrea decipioides]